MSQAGLLLAALLLDAALGEPRWLWSRLPHPAVLLGRAVAWLDRHLNRGAARRLKGSLGFAGLALAALALGGAVQALPGGGVPEVVLAAILLAQRSLAEHVRAVARGLRRGLAPGRAAVAMIVGRDVAALDRAGVARAAIESAAENFSDGVVAPAFWYLVGGLPGLLLYKLTNTADSMIGYRTPRHEAFGWAAARFDDALNWIPARLTAALIAAVFASRRAWAVVRRDARLHRSPNAGWPEAAMAGVLDVALAGPRSYGGRMRAYPFVHAAGRRDIGPAEIEAAVRVLWRGWAGLLALVAVLALL
jgi:adenosylcobinamide-phosphate synthase